MDKLKTLRLTGLAGISGALLMFSGDMLLYGGFYSGTEFYQYSRKIMSEIPLLRLMIGGAIGPMGAILYTIGFWQIYLALKNGSKVLAAITFSGFASMIIVGGTYHAGFVNIGLLLRTKKSLSEADLKSFHTLLENSYNYLHFLYTIVFVFGLIATIFFLYTVIFKKTLYPKWLIVFTPTLLTFTSPVARFIPSPAGGIIYGGYINLCFVLFFCASTALVWHVDHNIRNQ